MQERIQIDGNTYVREDKAGPPSELLIVVVEGRWNLIGRCEHTDSHLVVHNAQVIRYWGTTAGLGELALKGPTSKTKLDPAGLVRVPHGKVLLTLDVTAEGWAL